MFTYKGSTPAKEPLGSSERIAGVVAFILYIKYSIYCLLPIFSALIIALANRSMSKVYFPSR